MSTTIEKVHVFEQAGLGKAPFRYVGMEHQDISYGMRNVSIRTASGGSVECQTKPGGTCAYCGTYIVNMFNVESADGKRFHVGCECIRKTGDEGLKKLVDRDVKDMERRKRRARKAAKSARDKAYCEEMIATKSAEMASMPHPNEWSAKAGKTLLDYAIWMNSHNVWETLARVLKSKFK